MDATAAADEPCDICGASGSMRPEVAVSLVGVLEAEICGCGACGFRQVRPRLSPRELHALYCDEYLDSAGGFGFSDYARQQQRYERQGYFLAKRLRRSGETGRLLEVGCALGFLLAEQGHHQEAERWLRRGLAVRETAEVHNNLAWLLLQTGRVEEGLEHARRAVELRPGFAAAWDTLGVTLARAGRSDEAREAFERALELNPELKLSHDLAEEELRPL